VPSSSIFQFGLSASSNSNPSGILSFISLAYPAISPSLVILTLYSNLTTTFYKEYINKKSFLIYAIFVVLFSALGGGVVEIIKLIISYL